MPDLQGKREEESKEDHIGVTRETLALCQVNYEVTKEGGGVG